MADYIPTPEQLADTKLKIGLLDTGEGVNPSRLRVFYPKEGWGKIFARLNALKASNQVTVAMRGSPVLLEYYSVVPPAPGS